MNVIAEIAVNHSDMALVPTIQSVPAVEIEVVPHSATDPETGMFFFLVEARDGDFSSFERALENDHTVADAKRISESGRTRIYRLCHPDGVKLLSPKVAEVGGLILRDVSDGTGWSMRLQFSDRESITAAEGVGFFPAFRRTLSRSVSWIRCHVPSRRNRR